MRKSYFLARLLYIAVAFGALSLKAQNHNVSAFGYINVIIQPGLSLIGLQLDTANRSVNSLFTDMPEGAEIYKNVAGTFTTNVYQNGQWNFPDETITVGEGIFVLNPSTNLKIITFVGEILQGDLTNSIPAGLSIRCDISPHDGKITSTLGLQLSPFDNLYKIVNGVLQVFTHLPDHTWKPAEPGFLTGESFVINASRPINWITHFEVNQ